MKIYPSLLDISRDTYKKIENSDTPISIRLLSYGITIIHAVMVILYTYAILYSSDINTLYLVLIICFIIYQTTVYYKGCLLSSYENINSDIIPSMSEMWCYIFSGNTDICNEPHKIEIFLVSIGIGLPLFKIFGIYLNNTFTGKHYTCKVK